MTPEEWYARTYPKHNECANQGTYTRLYGIDPADAAEHQAVAIEAFLAGRESGIEDAAEHVETCEGLHLQVTSRAIRNLKKAGE